jgi:hypothetical protein
MPKFRVVMKEPLRIPENPFRPGLINECVRRREAVLEDADEASVRRHFAEAKALGMKSVEGFDLVSVELVEDQPQ